MAQNIDTLTDKFIEDSFVGKSEFSDTAIKAIHENLVSGIRRFYEPFLSANPPSLKKACFGDFWNELFSKEKLTEQDKQEIKSQGFSEDQIEGLDVYLLKKHQNLDRLKYLLPVRLLYGNKNGYTIQWFYKIGHSYGVETDNLFVRHNLINNEINTLEFEELPKSIIKKVRDGILLVEAIKKMKEAHYSTSDVNDRMMSWLEDEAYDVILLARSGHTEKDIESFKRSLAEYRSRDLVVDKMTANLVLTNEQIKNNNNLLRHSVSPSTELLIKNLSEYKRDVSEHLELPISGIFLEYKTFYSDLLSKFPQYPLNRILHDHFHHDR